MPQVTLGEFGRIAQFFAPLAHEEAAQGLQNDAAVFMIPQGCSLVTTMDTVVEGIHFLPDCCKTKNAAQLAQKLLGVNLSDLAAMGAKPYRYFLSLATGPRQGAAWFQAFAAGLETSQREYGLLLLGGDSVRTGGPITMTLTAMGLVQGKSCLKRDSAKAGQDLWVSGTLGRGAAGLTFLKQDKAENGNDTSVVEAIGHYRCPIPRVSLGAALLAQGLSSCAIDISDGLLADAAHIARASNLRIDIRADQIPLPAPFANLSRRALLNMALNGGDDYELLFTAEVGQRRLIEALGTSLHIPLRVIGTLKASPDGKETASVRLLDQTGTVVALPQKGWAHF